MTLHRIARDKLDEGLLALVRGGEHIDHVDLDVEADEWVVLTIDRIETRLNGITPAARLGFGGDAA